MCERHEDFSETMADCRECGAVCPRDEWERVKGRALCFRCARKERELEESLRPRASGVHVSAMRKAVLGALGFTQSYESDSPEVKSGLSYPHEEGTLSAR